MSLPRVSTSRDVPPQQPARTQSEPKPGLSPQKPKGINVVNREKSVFEAGGGRHTATARGPGGTTVDAFVEKPKFSVDARASAGLSRHGFHVDLGLKIDATAVKAGAGITKDVHFQFQGEDFKVRVRLGAETQVGANGEVKIRLNVGPKGVSADLGAEGFAGAKGSLTADIQLSANGKELASLGTKVTAMAGVAAGVKADVGFDHFSAKAYFSAGVGVGVETKGKANWGNIAKLIPQLFEPTDLWKNALQLGGVAQKGGEWVVGKTGEVLGDVGGWAKKTIGKVGDFFGL
jgi:hypothetical protein